MMADAIRHELGRLSRSPSRLITLAVFFILAALAVLAGQNSIASWNASLEQVEQQRIESQQSASQWLADGVSGPEDRDWVDITTPLWQDWYAGSRAIREPAPLAPIAAGSSDNSPSAIRVNRLANPFLEEGTGIEHPELGSSMAIDLVFVLAVLVPILVFVIGFGCGAYERETGIDRLIAVQRGRASTWFLYRSLVITLVSVFAVLVTLVAALGANGGLSIEAVDLLLVSVLYTLVWTGIFVATAVAAPRMREAAFSYGSAWVLLVVLVPAWMSEQSLTSDAARAGLTSALDLRAAQYEGYEADSETLLAQLYEARPDLRTMPAASLDELPDAIERHAFDWQRVQSIKTMHETKLAAENASIVAAERSMIWSPTVTLSLAAERLAGRDLASAQAFRSEAIDRIASRADWVVTEAWANEPLTAEDFETLIRSDAGPVQIAPASVQPHLIILSLWGLLAWALSVLLVRRQEPRD